MIITKISQDKDDRQVHYPCLDMKFSCLFHNFVKSVDCEDITFRTIVNRENTPFHFVVFKDIVHILLSIIRALPLFGNELIL